MAFEDTYRLSVHAVIVDEHSQVLQVRATYGDLGWGLPGGAVDQGETVIDTLRRECREELGCEVNIGPVTGMYLHTRYNSHAILFRCNLCADAVIKLSSEHSEWRYFPVDELSKVQQQRVKDSLNFDGQLQAAVF